MAKELTCPACQCSFLPPTRPGRRGICCPLCNHLCEPAEEDGPPVAKPRGTKCPGCKQIMERGVTYCPRCNVSLFDAWGETEARAPEVGRRAEMVGYANLAGKTVRIFVYFVTFRWWRILDEF